MRDSKTERRQNGLSREPYKTGFRGPSPQKNSTKMGFCTHFLFTSAFRIPYDEDALAASVRGACIVGPEEPGFASSTKQKRDVLIGRIRETFYGRPHDSNPV